MTSVIPRYLFRAISDQSRGYNAPDRIVPDAMCNGYGHESIHDIPPDEAKNMLEQHLLWDYTCTSEFSSWSSSLLFVLRHAVRKKYYDLAENVCICVLDTRKSIINCMYPATSLLKAYKVKSEGKLRHEYYATEYLLHGALENANIFSVVGLEILILQGLFQQFPELNEERESKDLYWRVQHLRRMFFCRTWPVTDEEIRALRKMAECFGDGELTVPMTAAFLSLRRRGKVEDIVLEKILIGPGRIRLPPWTPFDVAGFERLQSEAGNIHEVSEFAGLLQRLYDIQFRQGSQQTDQVLGSLQMLSLESGHEIHDPGDVDSGNWGCSTEDEGLDFEDEWDTDDEVEEANTNDDLMKMLEGDW